MRQGIILLLAACALSLTACAGGPPVFAAPGGQSAPEPEPVTLRIGWWGSQTRHDATLAALDLYGGQTGVRFSPEFMPIDDYMAKLNTLAVTNNLYDVFQLGGNFAIYRRYLEPLDSYLSRGLIDVSQTDAELLGTTRYEDVQYGISLGLNTYGIAYDPALFQKAGLTEPQPDWTWKDFEDCAAAIHRNLGIYGSSKLDEFFAGATMHVTQFGTDYTFFRRDGRGLAYPDDSFIADHYDRIYRLTKQGAYPDPAQLSKIKDIEGDYIVTGQAAMTWCASNQFVALSAAAGRPLALAAIPRQSPEDPSGIAIQSSQMLGISAASRHKEDCARFINFFVGDVEANLILRGERGVSIMTDVREALALTMDAAQAEAVRFVDEMGRIASHQIVLDPPQQPEIRELYQHLLEQVIFDQLTPQQAAAQLRSGAEEVFAKAQVQG